MHLPGKRKEYMPWSDDEFYRKDFNAPNLNLCYGLAWEWPTPRSAP